MKTTRSAHDAPNAFRGGTATGRPALGSAISGMVPNAAPNLHTGGDLSPLPVPRGRLAGLLDEVDKELCNLQDALARLSDALDPVMIPVPPEALASPPEPLPGDGTYGQACVRTAALARTVNRLAAAVNFMTARVEV